MTEKKVFSEALLREQMAFLRADIVRSEGAVRMCQWLLENCEFEGKSEVSKENLNEDQP